jgi:transcriptional regulator with XRE-family HTH domain
MADPSDLGRRLREIRTAARIPASSLSTAAGASRDVVRQIEEGLIAKPSAEMVSRIADVMGVSLDWLVDGRGDAPGAQDLEAALDRVRNANVQRTGTEG